MNLILQTVRKVGKPQNSVMCQQYRYAANMLALVVFRVHRMHQMFVPVGIHFVQLKTAVMVSNVAPTLCRTHQSLKNYDQMKLNQVNCKNSSLSCNMFKFGIIWRKCNSIAVLIKFNSTDPWTIKVCPNGAIPYKIPQVMLCDPSIVNICPYDYTCVEAANGHLLPEDARSLCCKTTTLYSFGKGTSKKKVFKFFNKLWYVHKFYKKKIFLITKNNLIW